MSTQKRHLVLFITFTLTLMFSAAAAAHGGWHGGSGGWSGGGAWHQGGGWHDGAWHGGGYYGGTVILGAPAYEGYSCQTVQVCNNYGNCWLQDSCY